VTWKKNCRSKQVDDEIAGHHKWICRNFALTLTQVAATAAATTSTAAAVKEEAVTSTTAQHSLYL